MPLPDFDKMESTQFDRPNSSEMRSPAGIHKFIRHLSKPNLGITLSIAIALGILAIFRQVSVSRQSQFDPHQTVTRSQLAQLIKAAFDYPPNTSCRNFPDVSPGDRAYVAITTLKCNGIVNGNKDREYQFLPQNSVTRAEAAKFIVNAFNQQVRPAFHLQSQGKTLPFSDVSAELGGLEYFIELAYVAGWMNGKNGKFLPKNPLTQTELQQILSRSQIDFHRARNPHRELERLADRETLCLWWYSSRQSN